eukprot:GABW01001734.1.p3 GENE.GABW01001734.1~~GABW01001734.1.p3  ORF type:complete len:58 (+),score=11.57 GABW01001734.1:95-268(+)
MQRRPNLRLCRIYVRHGLSKVLQALLQNSILRSNGHSPLTLSFTSLFNHVMIGSLRV